MKDPASVHHLARQVREWQAESAQIAASRAQLRRRGVLLVLGAGSAIGLALGVLSTGRALQGADEMRLPLTALSGGLTFLLMLLWVLLVRSPSPRAIFAGMTLATLIHLGAVGVNGVVSLAMLPGFVVAHHLLLPLRAAAGLSIGLTFGSCAAMLILHPGQDLALGARVVLVSVGMLVALQWAFRHWGDISAAFAQRCGEMDQAISTVVSDLKQAEGQLDATLNIDPDSGLPNQQGFERRAQVLLDGAGGSAPAQMLSVQIEGWAPAWEKADPTSRRALIRSVADQLTSLAPPGALIGRIEPDLWAVLVVGRPDTPFASADLSRWAAGTIGLDAAAAQEIDPLDPRLAQAVLDGLAGALRKDHPQAAWGPRVGWTARPRDGSDASTLLRRASLARLWAGRSAMTRPSAFDAAMEHQAGELGRLGREIRDGLERAQFALHYQPIIDTAGGALSKAEALIRWHHPTRGCLLPAAFIATAEQGGLIVEITDWVLREAAAQVRQWRRTLHPQFAISVNIPPAWLERCVSQPQDTLVRLAALDVPPGGLVFEITEGAMLNPSPATVAALNRLRGQGVRMALDDFGVAYSSFGQIGRLPLAFLKLDKALVDHVAEGPRQEAVCQALIDLAHRMDLAVVAEGVESPTQHEALARMGCDHLQGFRWSQPLPAQAFEAWATPA